MFLGIGPKLFHFPREDKIVDYLAHHPDINSVFLTDCKIIEAVASHFAHTHKKQCELVLGVEIVLERMRTGLKLSEFSYELIRLNLIQALIDFPRAP